MGRLLTGFAVALGAALSVSPLSVAALEPSYEIRVRLDTEQHELHGEETISFVNDTGNALEVIYLHLYPNRFMDDQGIYAREKGIDGYDLLFPNGPDSGYTFIEELKLNGTVHGYKIDDTIMELDLEEPLLPGGSIELYLKFRVKIPHAIARFGHDRGNYYISWWYPRLAAYDGKGWHPYQAHGTYPDEPYDNFARYKVQITLPQEMVVGATGVQEGIVQNPDGTKTLTYTAENVHDFAWVADRRYRVETLSWEGVTIRSLYFPEDEAAGRRAAQHAKDALSYFSARYGRYPYENFTVAETRMLGGAMEYPQLIMVTYAVYRLPQLFTILDEVIAHETAHQWFYGMLMNDQVNEAWLDEGFATFSEISYIEHKYGKEANLMDLEEIGKLPLIGPYLKRGTLRHGPNTREQRVLKPYLAVARAGLEEPLLTPRDRIRPDREPLFYQRGALTLLALEYLVGQETFDKLMQTYFQRYRFRQVTTADFIQVAEEVSGQDLKWFFDGWLRSTAGLDYVLEGVSSHKIGERFITRVAIRSDGGLRMPVDVQVSLEKRNGGKEKGKITERFWPLDRRGTLTFITDRPVESVVIDPERVLPDLDRANNELVPPLKASPSIEHGTMRGHREDGFILGLSSQAPRLHLKAQLAHALGSHRLLYNLSWDPPSWKEAWGSFSLEAGLGDDGHILSAGAEASLQLSAWISDLARWSNGVKLRAFYKDLHNVSGDRGTVSGIELIDELVLKHKEGWRASLKLDYGGSFAAFESDFPFNRFMTELGLRQRLSWRTHLDVRLFLGMLQGRMPNDEGRFSIRRDGHFRTFKRDDDLITAINLSLNAPIPQLNKLDLGPIPLSLGLVVFADLGRFGPGFGATRAELGWGLMIGIYGLESLFRLEQVLWTNTREDGGRPGFKIGISLGT